MKSLAYILFASLSMMWFSCLEPYIPPYINGGENFLVVDGFIDCSQGVATVKLSYTVPLSVNKPPLPELNAKVSIETGNGNIFQLTEKGGGVYVLTGLVPDYGTTYTLRLITSSGKEYQSKAIQLLHSPGIDSITWKPEADGVSFLVHTHDVTGNTKYYKWEYIETWEYNAPFQSAFKLVNKQPVVREYFEDIYTCWRTLPSTTISVASSEKLSMDVIQNFPINFIPRGSVKTSRRYSLLVKQSALTKEAFTYWQLLQKTTESLGGLFDPLPSQITGNLFSLNNANEPVLGYFSGGEVRDLRVFLVFNNLPDYLRVPPSYTTQCELDSANLKETSALPSFNLLVNEILEGITVVGYTYTTISCADCRTMGGTTTKPSFW